MVVVIVRWLVLTLGRDLTLAVTLGQLNRHVNGVRSGLLAVHMSLLGSSSDRSQSRLHRSAGVLTVVECVRLAVILLGGLTASAVTAVATVTGAATRTPAGASGLWLLFGRLGNRLTVHQEAAALAVLAGLARTPRRGPGQRACASSAPAQAR